MDGGKYGWNYGWKSLPAPWLLPCPKGSEPRWIVVLPGWRAGILQLSDHFELASQMPSSRWQRGPRLLPFGTSWSWQRGVDGGDRWSCEAQLKPKWLCGAQVFSLGQWKQNQDRFCPTNTRGIAFFLGVCRQKAHHGWMDNRKNIRRISAKLWTPNQGRTNTNGPKWVVHTG